MAVRQFNARYDRTTKTISALVCGLLLVIVLATQSRIGACIAVLAASLAYGFSPRGYQISDRAIIVRRLVGKVAIALEGIREVRPATADDLRGAIRLWGSGGFFGYYGLFQTPKLGHCIWYVTNRSRIVLVMAGEKTFAFSPEDTSGFVNALQPFQTTRMQVESQPAPAQGTRGPVWRIRAIGLAVAAMALAFLGLALSYSPGLPAYTLTPVTLAIHDRFYPVTLGARDIDMAHVAVVDINARSEWRPVARTNGFANPHYRAGWFRVASGRTVRMYRAEGTRLVLLPPGKEGEPVLLEVKDPDGFIGQLHREWGSHAR